jgi:fumarylpyruvate hydrolase
VIVMELAIAPCAPTLLAVADSTAPFPVQRIYCIGRNYAWSAGEPRPQQMPGWFMKPADALMPAQGTLPYPPGTQEFCPEIELVVAIGVGGRDLDPAQVEAHHLWGYAAGLDMTRRDLQLVAREKGRPWDLGKDVEQSSVVSEIVPMPQTVLSQGELEMSVNGKVRQKSDLSKLIWNIPELIADLSKFYHLLPGDLIFTGTPEGVGALQPGDRIDGQVEGVGTIVLNVGPAE